MDGDVRSSIVLSNGDLLIGGNYSLASNLPAFHIARFRTDTQSWATLAEGVAGSTYGLLELPNGDILAGTSPVSRFNASTQTWTHYGQTLGGTIYAMSRLADGRVVLGGQFSTIDHNVSIHNVGFFDVNSGIITPMGSGITCNFCQGVHSMVVLSDDSVLVGGDFASASGIPATHLARYFPATNSWSVPTTAPNGTIEVMKVMPDGDVIVGGSFTMIGGQAFSRVARYSPSTDSWTSMGGVVNGTVYAIATNAAGSLFIGGAFTSAGGNAASSRIARYMPATNNWLGDGSTSISGVVYTLAPTPDGDIVVGGSFARVGGVPATQNIAVLHTDNLTWGPAGKGTNGAVNAIAKLPTGDMIVGGQFTLMRGTKVNQVARYSPATDSASPLALGVLGTVNAVASVSDDLVAVGGTFSSLNGILFPGCIALYVPSRNLWSSAGGGISTGAVNVIAPLGNGDFLAGGLFTFAGSVAGNNLARFSTATGTWSAFGTGTNGRVRCIQPLPDGKVLVAGEFTSAGGRPANKIALLNLQTGVWRAIGSNPTINNTVRALALIPNGDIVVAGDFDSIGGISGTRLIGTYSPISDSWRALPSVTTAPNTFINSVVVTSDGDIYAGGNMGPGNIGSQHYFSITLGRFSVADQAWHSLAGNLGYNRSGLPVGWPLKLALTSANDLLVGGSYQYDFIDGSGIFTINSPRAYFSTYFPDLPTVVAQPQSVATCLNSPVQLSVTTAGDGPLTFQWFQDGYVISPLVNPSATTNSLLIPSLTFYDLGEYTC
ncbi:MAG: immunoglobulin domain-containing protein, partial [Phycisphaerales bacterium]